uniref:Venom protein n=1 Tax=Ampulex compressa TaxID=860918 RepID=A0A1W6EVV4_AMPCP|nr:venom protein [Ampulex compressa]
MNSLTLYNMATLMTTLMSNASETLFKLQMEVDQLKVDTQRTLIDLEYHRNITEIDLYHEINVQKAHSLTIVILSSFNRVKIELQTYESENKTNKLYCLKKCKDKLQECSIIAYDEMNPCVNMFISDMRNFLQKIEKKMQVGKNLIIDLKQVNSKCNIENIYEAEECVRIELSTYKQKLQTLREDFEKLKERISEDKHRILGQSSQCFELARLTLQQRTEQIKIEAFTCIWDSTPQ